MTYNVYYRYQEGAVKTLGYNFYKGYKQHKTAKRKIESFQNDNLISLSQKFGITPKQAKTLEYTIYISKNDL